MSRRFFILSLLVGLSLLAPPYGAYSLDEKPLLAQAEAYRKDGAYLEAIGIYQSLQILSPKPSIKALAHLRIAEIYAQSLKDFDRATEEYASLIEKYEKSSYAAQALFASAMIKHETGRKREARELFRRYLSAYPAGEAREMASFMLDAAGFGQDVPPVKTSVNGPADNESIRVLLEKAQTHLTIGARSLKILQPHYLSTPGDSSSVFLEFRPGGLYLDGQWLEVETLVFAEEKGGFLQYGGNAYRGSLIVKVGPAGLDLINELPLEAYLYGVVPREMPSRWPLEAIRAQAVVARSYAFYVKRRAASPDYHLCATTLSQVYQGANFETELSRQAVDDTRGQILYYRQMPALTYYHAHSGGMTEDPRYVWSVPLPYLRAVLDDFSLKATASQWSVNLDFETIRRSLNRAGMELGPIREIAPVEFSPSQRLVRLRIIHEGGEAILGGNDFRLMLDPKVVRSTMFKITNSGNAVTLEGRGYGHGVGLSQWGALAKAQEGYSYREILSFYYPELELK